MRAQLRTVLILVLSFGLAACPSTGPRSARAPADTAAGEIPFDLAGPGGAAIVVPVVVNGTGPYPFVLDTGATMTCVDVALADSLDLPPMRGAVGRGAGVGGGGPLRLVRFDSIRVENASATGLPGCVIDLGQLQGIGLEAHGLLGLNFLKPFRVSLDFERSMLTLVEP